MRRGKKETLRLFHKPRDPFAWLWRRCLHKTEVIAITGSCGKTSATRFLDHILSGTFKGHGVHLRNGHGFIVKNILKVRPSDTYYVQEVSAHSPGFLDTVLPLLKPTISMVTAIGQDHYTNYRSLEATAGEKGKIVEVLPDSGIAILNMDDPHVCPMVARTQARVIGYGLSKDADLRASEVKSTWPHRLSMVISYGEERLQLNTRLFGRIWLSSVLAAIAGGLALGLGLRECVQRMESVEPVTGRMSIHHAPTGAWFINDTAKAPFWTVASVCEELRDSVAPRTTLLFGAFSDIGSDTSRKYRRIAKLALEIADRVIFVGEQGKYVEKLVAQYPDGKLQCIPSVKEAANYLASDVIEDEVIMVKSNLLGHLERLFYDQDDGVQCWKEQCAMDPDCGSCEFRQQYSES